MDFNEKLVESRCGTLKFVYFEVLEDVGGVGHAEAEHAAIRDHLNELGEELGKRGAQVAAVSARVFGGEPDLADALLERLHGPGDDFIRRVTAQLASGVLRFAVRALVEAAGVDWYDLDQRVLADFG